MFTHLFDQFVASVGTMPVFIVYGIVALWIGMESIGIPLPMELMLLFSGSLAALGDLSLILALATAVLASLAFSAAAYTLGRQAGAPAVTRVGRHVGLTGERVDHIDAWLRRRGVVGVVLGRIIPGVRGFSSYVMGIAGISAQTFAIGAAISAVGYFSIWMIVGAALGRNYRVPLRYLDQLGLVGLTLALAALAGAIVLHRILGRRALGRLAVQFAHHSALAAGAAGAVASPSASLAGGEMPRAMALRMSRMPSAPMLARAAAAARQRAYALPSPDRRLPELGELRQAMRASAARLWQEWLARALAAAWVVVLVVFVLLAVAAHQTPAFPIDRSLSATLQQLNSTPLGRPITFLGDLQGPLGAAVAYVVLLGALAICRFFWEALGLAVSGLGAEATNIVVNGVVARPRPEGDVTHTLLNLGAHSFPSGHTVDCVGLYGFVFYLAALATTGARPRWRPWLIGVQVVCAVFILNVGVSRVVEGQHQPSDVAGGYLLGGLVLLASIALYHRLMEREAGVVLSGTLPLVVTRAQALGTAAAVRAKPAWEGVATTTTRLARDAGAVDRRVAGEVGLRGEDLQARFRAPWPSWTIALVAAVWTELATLVVLLAVSAHRYATFPLDVSLAAAVHQLKGTPLAAVIYPAGDLQWYLPTAIAYVIIFGTLLVLRLYLAALFTALSSFGTDLVNVAINTIVDRPRPHGVRIPTLTSTLGSASFPSGHVAHVVGLYGFVFFLCVLALRARPRDARLRPWLLAIQAVCVYFIAFVGLSRMLEGQHWPSDVAGGYLVGATVLALVIVLYHVVAMRSSVPLPHAAARAAVPEPALAPASSPAGLTAAD